jgi:hypothetical protein
MSAKRRANGALDYREDDDDNESSAPPNKRPTIHVTQIPVLLDDVSFDAVIHCVRPLEMMINRALIEITNGRELVYFDLNFRDVLPYRELKEIYKTVGPNGLLSTYDVQDVLYFDRRPSNRRGRHGHTLLRRSREVPKRYLYTRTAPVLVLTESSPPDNEQLPIHTEVESLAGYAWFPFAKLLYIHPNRTLRSMGDVRAFSIRFHGVQEEIDEPTLQSTREFLDPVDYIARLASESPRVTSTSDIDSESSEQKELEIDKKRIREQRLRHQEQMDPQYKDDPYVYAHAPNTLTRLAIETSARSVELNMDTGGHFMDDDDVSKGIEHLVQWVLKYSAIHDRKRNRVIDDQAYGGALPFGLPAIIGDYAAGAHDYTQELPETEEEEQDVHDEDVEEEEKKED